MQAAALLWDNCTAHLISEGTRHDEGRVARSTAQIQQTPLC